MSEHSDKDALGFGLSCLIAFFIFLVLIGVVMSVGWILGALQ